MYTEKKFYSSTDQIEIVYYVFKSQKPEKGVIQFAHGMMEKALRYKRTIEKFNDAGFTVYINDHRGHGKSAHKAYGYMGEGDVYLKMVRDMRSLNKIIHDENPELPVIMLAHSMGSFLAQRYVQVYPDTVNMLLLSGTSGRNQVPVSKLGKVVSKGMMRVFGDEKEAKLISKVQNIMFNSKIKKPKSNADWLSTDVDEVERFVKSEDMGFNFTTSAYHYLFKGISENFNPSNIKRIPKNLPILIFSGNQDPVGENGKGPLDLYNLYINCGLKKVTLKLYPEKRHELFNETNREEVVKDVLVFIKNNI